LERYAKVSGRDLDAIDFYVAFAFWKLACILEGVYSRYLGGALGDVDRQEIAAFRVQVERAAELAERYVERLT
jgi:aminoglycoside phosphotransferase (APT) family kinase protein